jgi:hypothetical protein
MELDITGMNAGQADLAATALMCNLDKKSIAEWM